MSASITGFDAYALPHKKMCRYLRAVSKGKACDHAATESHGRNWKMLPARAEIAIGRVKWWQAMTEHHHAHLQTNGGNLGTAPRRATNVDIRRCLSAHSKSFRSSRNTLSSQDPTPNSCTAARKTLVTGKTYYERVPDAHTRAACEYVHEDTRMDWYLTPGLHAKRT